jgi:HD-GYP domain-containing protein (c-di-GMP phosphodiesterase class II)
LEKCIATLQEDAGVRFDPAVVAAFQCLVDKGKFPVDMKEREPVREMRM